MNKFNHKTFSVAPMMGWTTRHCRMFHRQLTKEAKLYTEMVTTGAIIYGHYERFLAHSRQESPVVLQLGGSDPVDLAKSISIASQYHYDEFNLNVGCPSDRVQRGKIGAILMLEPDLVARCYSAMQAETTKVVSIKCRLSVDDMPETSIFNFIDKVATKGCQNFIIHARKAFLNGLDPKANRDVPPLRYDLVYEVKSKFPELNIVLNGGVKTQEDIKHHYQYVDGVMVGREAYYYPWILSEVDPILTGNKTVLTREESILKLIPYIKDEINKGNHIKYIARHWMGLFHGQAGTVAFKRYLSENLHKRNDVDLIYEALDKLNN